MAVDAVHPAALDAGTLLKQCDVRRTRRSGPGGQHRNKVETAVVLTHRPTGIVAEAGERRSQSENRTVAISRLRLKLAIQVRQPLTNESGASELWRSRCRGGKVAVSTSHEDFPTLLAEALDVLAACGYDFAAAAERLDCTASQLVKLLRAEPAALAAANAARRTLELPSLK